MTKQQDNANIVQAVKSCYKKKLILEFRFAVFTVL